MNEGQIIVGFLFPAHQQSSRAVGPTVRAFDDPATRALTALRLPAFFAASLNMRRVAPAARDDQSGLAFVACIEAKMLSALSRGARASNGYASESRCEKFLIVDIRACDRDCQRHASTIGED